MNEARKPWQDELALVRPLSGEELFPGREFIYVLEVARVLSISENQVIDLIESGELVAVNIASRLYSDQHPKGSKTPRAYWRVSVKHLTAFLQARKSS